MDGTIPSGCLTAVWVGGCFEQCGADAHSTVRVHPNQAVIFCQTSLQELSSQ